jgi:hypothetical protein
VSLVSRYRARTRLLLLRHGPSLWLILLTAAVAVLAWWLIGLLLPTYAAVAVFVAALALVAGACAMLPDPELHVAQAANAVVDELARVLELLAVALEERDAARAAGAVEAARGLDRFTGALGQAIAIGREAVRPAPLGRGVRAELDRYSAVAASLQLAVHDVRVLARHIARRVREDGERPEALSLAVRDLKLAVWALALELDGDQAPDVLRAHAARAVARAGESWEETTDLGVAEMIVQVRATAVDLVRASESAAPGAPTDELLAVAA